MSAERDQRYLGDGVYGEYEDGVLILRANDIHTPSDTIFLEPEVVTALQRYIEEHKR